MVLNKVRPAERINKNLKYFIGKKELPPSHTQQDHTHE